MTIKDIYYFGCDEVDEFEKLEPEFAKQFGLTVQEFCTFEPLSKLPILGANATIRLQIAKRTSLYPKNAGFRHVFA